VFGMNLLSFTVEFPLWDGIGGGIRSIMVADGWRIGRDRAMRVAKLGGVDAPTVLTIVATGAICYSAWLTSIVFCATNDQRPLMIAAAAFFPVGIVHGIGVWFGGW
jgi:hypothetical protein